MSTSIASRLSETIRSKARWLISFVRPVPMGRYMGEFKLEEPVSREGMTLRNTPAYLPYPNKYYLEGTKRVVTDAGEETMYVLFDTETKLSFTISKGLKDLLFYKEPKA